MNVNHGSEGDLNFAVAEEFPEFEDDEITSDRKARKHKKKHHHRRHKERRETDDGVDKSAQSPEAEPREDNKQEGRDDLSFHGQKNETDATDDRENQQNDREIPDESNVTTLPDHAGENESHDKPQLTEEKVDEARKRRRKKKKHKRSREEKTKVTRHISWQDETEEAREIPDELPEGKTQAIVDWLESRVYVIDAQTCSPNMLSSQDCPNVIRRAVTKQSTDGARGLIALTEGLHVFEISFNDKPWGSHCSVGVCSQNVPMMAKGYKHLIGGSAEGWAWDIPSRSLLHGGEKVANFPSDHENMSEVPRTIYMTVDCENRTLSYNIGNGLKTAFTDLPEKLVLYPAVSMVYGQAEVTFNLISSSLYAKYSWLVDAFNKQKLKEKEETYQDQKEPPDDNHEDQNTEKTVGALIQIPELKIEEEHAGKISQDAEIHTGDPNVRTDQAQPNEKNSDHDSDSECMHVKQMVKSKESWKLPKDTVNRTFKPGEVPPPFHYRKKYESSSSEDEEEDNINNESITNVSDLSPGEQYLVQIAHGWDFIQRGSLIQPHPNVPQICVPMPALKDRIQGIRCRRGFEGRGVHSWSVKELIMYSPNVPYADMVKTQNNVIIGVASNEQRKYNFGFSMSDLGPNIWGLQYPDMVIWHDKKRYTPKQLDNDQGFELTDGLEMTLNLMSHRLTFSCSGRVLATVRDVKGEKLYPFVMYNMDAYWPLEINYKGGPKDYLEEVLSAMNEVSSLDHEDVNNKRVLMHRSSSHGELRESSAYRDSFIWGPRSSGVSMYRANVAGVTDCSGLCLAAYSLGGSRHKLRFKIEGGTAGVVLGLVHTDYHAQDLTEGNLSTDPCPGQLGNDLFTWGWDIQDQKLYHGSRLLGIYPVDEDFDPDEVVSVTLTLDFSPLGYNTAAYSVVTSDNKERVLGIAFVCLPHRVYPAVVMSGPQQTVTMEYVAGPWKDDMVLGERTVSQACTIQ